MPLSEHEQKLLEQIERALVDDDPKFASQVRTGDRRKAARRKLQLGALLVVAGLAALVGGAALPSVPLGVIGFLVMLAGAGLGVLNYKHATGAVEAGSASGGQSKSSGRGAPKARKQPLKDRLEERFRRRYEG